MNYIYLLRNIGGTSTGRKAPGRRKDKKKMFSSFQSQPRFSLLLSSPVLRTFLSVCQSVCTSLVTDAADRARGLDRWMDG